MLIPDPSSQQLGAFVPILRQPDGGDQQSKRQCFISVATKSGSHSFPDPDACTYSANNPHAGTYRSPLLTKKRNLWFSSPPVCRAISRWASSTRDFLPVRREERSKGHGFRGLSFGFMWSTRSDDGVDTVVDERPKPKDSRFLSPLHISSLDGLRQVSPQPPTLLGFLLFVRGDRLGRRRGRVSIEQPLHLTGLWTLLKQNRKKKR